jgi:hypothetical protein
MSRQNGQGVSETMARALELTDEALNQVSRIAIEEIRDGLEASSHVEAAERHMRDALRQLVLAEREFRSRRPRKASLESAPDVVVVPESGTTLQRGS